MQQPKQRGRKKTRQGPPYFCDYENCTKSFQRSEHLSRHKLNHNPHTIFKCQHCEKTFVRHDLLIRHVKRHEAKLERQKSQQNQPPPNNPSGFLNNVLQENNIGEISPPNELYPLQTSEEQPQYSQSPVLQHPEYSNTSYTTGSHPNFLNWLFTEKQMQLPPTVPNNEMFDLNDFRLSNGHQSFFISDDLYDLNSFSSVGGGGSTLGSTPGNTNNNINNNININLDNNVNIGFPIDKQSPSNHVLQTFQHSQGVQSSQMISNDNLWGLTAEQMNQFLNLIPCLSTLKDFTILKFQKALKTYWNFFDPRFPMVHKPSFNSRETEPILLLSMVMLGSKLFNCVDNVTCDVFEILSNPKLLSDTICKPLRWLIFSSPNFAAPAKVWIIQSLLLLEFYEKHSTSRQLHERGHIHHGTTIQLLRRSPTLGGSPTKYSGKANDDKIDNWVKWIEVESLKRATFMCFYMDATDAINFGHQMLIYAHQIQMKMPVADKIWESNFNDFNKNYKNVTPPNLFLIDFKNLMNGESAKANSFCKKILLAGLSAILFQIQQRDMQLIFGIDKFSNTIANNWRDLLTVAFSVWRNDVGESCCSSKTAINDLNLLGNSSQFSTSDTRCKCINYHIAHVYMSVSHYDIMIVAGAPWRMNVKPNSKAERLSIEKRVLEWSKTRHAEVSVVQCYLLLFEMYLSPQDSTYDYDYDYLPDADLFFRSYVIGYCLLVIWCYNYVKFGFKSIDLNNECNQNGIIYLKKIREQFTNSSGIKLHTWFKNSSGTKFYGDLMKWVNVLHLIQGTSDVIGILELVGSTLSKAEYTPTREMGKLILFCKERSMGRNGDGILEDMYLL